MRTNSLHIVLMSLIVFGAMSLSMVPAQAQDGRTIVVIANKAFVGQSLSLKEVKRIFQKTVKRYKGKRIMPVHAKKSSPLRMEFTQKVLGMTVADEQSFWQDERVRNGTTPPPELTNTLRAVFSSGTGISYCYKKDFNPAVAKILLEI